MAETKTYILLCLAMQITGNLGSLYNYYGSLDYISEINSQNLSWTAGDNFGHDLSWEEMLNLVGSERRHTFKPRNTPIIESDDLPGNLDLREKYKNCPTIGTVYNQGNCRSAWALVPAATLTDHVCIQTEGRQKTPFSAQHILTCCRLCGRGCKGGWDDAAFFFFERHGAVTGGGYNSNTGCHPYTIAPCDFSASTNDTHGCKPGKLEETPKCRIKCSNPNYKTPFKKDLYKIKVIDSPQTTSQAKTILANKGPLETSFEVYSDFIHYKSGIYRRTENAKFIGHQCIKIIGYGEENSDNYWLAVNTWGDKWGDKGTVKFPLYSKELDYLGKVMYPVLNPPK